MKAQTPAVTPAQRQTKLAEMNQSARSETGPGPDEPPEPGRETVKLWCPNWREQELLLELKKVRFFVLNDF